MDLRKEYAKRAGVFFENHPKITYPEWLESRLKDAEGILKFDVETYYTQDAIKVPGMVRNYFDKYGIEYELDEENPIKIPRPIARRNDGA